MFGFLAKRLLLTIPTFLGLMYLTFEMIRRVPGDPIEVRRGERGISPERHAQLMKEMGLDLPVLGPVPVAMPTAFCTATSAPRSSPARRC